MRQPQGLGTDRAAPSTLGLAAVCLVVGGVAVFAFRLAHGYLPAGEPEAALRFTSRVVGATTAVAAITLALAQASFPGVLLYGLLVSLVQLWSVALGVVIWRRRNP